MRTHLLHHFVGSTSILGSLPRCSVGETNVHDDASPHRKVLHDWQFAFLDEGSISNVSKEDVVVRGTSDGEASDVEKFLRQLRRTETSGITKKEADVPITPIPNVPVSVPHVLARGQRGLGLYRTTISLRHDGDSSMAAGTTSSNRSNSAVCAWSFAPRVVFDGCWLRCRVYAALGRGSEAFTDWPKNGGFRPVTDWVELGAPFAVDLTAFLDAVLPDAPYQAGAGNTKTSTKDIKKSCDGADPDQDHIALAVLSDNRFAPPLYRPDFDFYLFGGLVRPVEVEYPHNPVGKKCCLAQFHDLMVEVTRGRTGTAGTSRDAYLEVFFDVTRNSDCCGKRQHIEIELEVDGHLLPVGEQRIALSRLQVRGNGDANATRFSPFWTPELPRLLSVRAAAVLVERPKRRKKKQQREKKRLQTLATLHRDIGVRDPTKPLPLIKGVNRHDDFFFEDSAVRSGLVCLLKIVHLLNPDVEAGVNFAVDEKPAATGLATDERLELWNNVVPEAVKTINPKNLITDADAPNPDVTLVISPLGAANLLHYLVRNQKNLWEPILAVLSSDPDVVLSVKDLSVYARSFLAVLFDVVLVKDLNCNFVRGSHYAQSSFFLELADRLGLLVWEENLSWQPARADFGHAGFRRAQVEGLARTVVAHRRFVSVLVWGVMNEADAREKRVEALKALEERQAMEGQQEVVSLAQLDENQLDGIRDEAGDERVDFPLLRSVTAGLNSMTSLNSTSVFDVVGFQTENGATSAPAAAAEVPFSAVLSLFATLRAVTRVFDASSFRSHNRDSSSSWPLRFFSFASRYKGTDSAKIFALCDAITFNDYPGWYDLSSDLGSTVTSFFNLGEQGRAIISSLPVLQRHDSTSSEDHWGAGGAPPSPAAVTTDGSSQEYPLLPRPLLIGETGAGGFPGFLSASMRIWSEERQALILGLAIVAVLGSGRSRSENKKVLADMLGGGVEDDQEDLRTHCLSHPFF